MASWKRQGLVEVSDYPAQDYAGSSSEYPVDSFAYSGSLRCNTVDYGHCWHYMEVCFVVAASLEVLHDNSSALDRAFHNRY